MDKNLSHVWQDGNELETAMSHYERLGSPAGRGAHRRALRYKLLVWRGVIRFTLALKRVLDVAGSLVAIVLLAPVFLATWLAIRIEDGGRAIFVQQRVGLLGEIFPMYKFRSMVVNADQLKDQLLAQNESAAGVLFKIKRDPRVTRVGQVIRKLSIDELPQLFNVLAGHMSLVGPRPALPREVALYRPEERVRLEVKPGITCLWQIGGRSDIDFKGQVRLDVQYIREQSVLLDLAILLKTVPVVLFGKGAY